MLSLNLTGSQLSVNYNRSDFGAKPYASHTLVEISQRTDELVECLSKKKKKMY